MVFEGRSEGGIVVMDRWQVRRRMNAIKTQEGLIGAPNSKVNLEDSSKYRVRLIFL